MSSTSSDTQYTIGFGNAGQGFNFQGEIAFDTSLWTDAQAFAFFDAFNSLPWPSGVSNGSVIQKTQNSNTTWVTDLASSPPSFT